MVKDIDASSWDKEVLRSSKPVVVDFWHEQCLWCKRLKPVYQELSDEFEKMTFTWLNIRSSHDNMHVQLRYGIMATPTMKVFCEGREVGEIIGYLDKDTLRDELERILEDSHRCLAQTTIVEPID